MNYQEFYTEDEIRSALKGWYDLEGIDDFIANGLKHSEPKSTVDYQLMNSVVDSYNRLQTYLGGSLRMEHYPREER